MVSNASRRSLHGSGVVISAAATAAQEGAAAVDGHDPRHAALGTRSVDDGGETEPMPVEGQGVTVSAAHDAQGELVLVVGKCTDETKRSLDHWFVVWDLKSDGNADSFSGVVWNYTGNSGTAIAVDNATSNEWFEMGCVVVIPVWIR